jgi:hypothetical protein
MLRRVRRSLTNARILGFFRRLRLNGCPDFFAGGSASGTDAVGSTSANGLLTLSWSAAMERHCSTNCCNRALSDLCFVFEASGAIVRNGVIERGH